RGAAWGEEPMGQHELDTLAVNTIRFLAADAVQRANSGHPGLPMGAAPAAYVLWSRHLKHAPTSPRWPDRDRFVLSAGHGSMLLYALPTIERPDLVLLATGSELHLIVAAEALLEKQGARARLVSMPCWQLFDEQPAAYRDEVLPPDLGPRLAVEAGVSLGWHRWIGPPRHVLSLAPFAASPPPRPGLPA